MAKFDIVEEALLKLKTELNIDDEECMLVEEEPFRKDPKILKSIEEHINYHSEHLTYWKEVEKAFNHQGEQSAAGYEALYKKNLPRKPQSFSFLSQAKTSPRPSKKLEQMKGQELLDELENHVIKDRIDSCDIPVFSDSIKNVVTIKNIVKSSGKMIDQKQSALLSDYVRYGLWMLKLCMCLDPSDFQNFVNENCGTGVSWGYKIMKVAKVSNLYPRLQQLNITITTAVKIISNLQSALQVFPASAYKWTKV